MNAAIYARVSTDKQAEQGYSLGAQIADCTAKARSLGATLVQEFIDDGYSGAYLDRPALTSMRDAVRAKMFDFVVVYDIDRLSRNLSHQLLITDDIESAGAQLHFVNADYKASAEGRLFYAIRGAFAGYEREKIRERSMRGRVAMLKQGKVIEDSHVYGYDFDKENHCYIINELEARNIREIFRLYLMGFGGTSAIARHFNANIDKFPPPNRRKWAVSTIHDILKREMYTGRFFAHKTYHFRTGLKSERRIERPPDEWIPMQCPPIISDEEHKRAVELLSKNRTFDLHRKRTPFLFQGLLYCTQCGRMLNVRRNGKNVAYYMCIHNQNDGNFASCGSRNFQCAPTDAALWELLESICQSPEAVENYIRKSLPPPAPGAGAEDARQQELSRIHQERQSILQWVGDGLISHEDATARLKALKAAENRLARVNTCKPLAPVRTDAGAVYEAVRNCPPTPDAKRQIVRQVIDHINIMRTDAGTGRKHYQFDIQIFFRK
ncbi:recombinase family protein [Selenomonas sp. AB3002]|uniref:recombinase family protein n=1 Tax=Selenomonas sp. AB3002 TaxID=1392502 RepID=UPI00068CD398